jgi:hypothetical protein
MNDKRRIIMFLVVNNTHIQNIDRDRFFLFEDMNEAIKKAYSLGLDKDFFERYDETFKEQTSYRSCGLHSDITIAKLDVVRKKAL